MISVIFQSVNAAAFHHHLKKATFRSNHNKEMSVKPGRCGRDAQEKGGQRETHQNSMGKRLTENERWEEGMLFLFRLIAPSLLSHTFPVANELLFPFHTAAAGPPRQCC